VILIHQRHRQTDRLTDGRHAVSIPRRGKNEIIGNSTSSRQQNAKNRASLAYSAIYRTVDYTLVENGVILIGASPRVLRYFSSSVAAVSAVRVVMKVAALSN